jgi:hypothetical protein
VAQQSIPFAPPQDGAQSMETSPPQFQMPEVVLHLNGELIEALCVNSCNSDQLVLASNRKVNASFFLSSFLMIFFLILMDSDGWVHEFPDFLLLRTETTAAERLKKVE